MKTRPTYWDLNREALVKNALEKYKTQNCGSASYDILRYAAKGVLKTTTDVTADQFFGLVSF